MFTPTVTEELSWRRPGHLMNGSKRCTSRPKSSACGADRTRRGASFRRRSGEHHCGVGDALASGDDEPTAGRIPQLWFMDAILQLPLPGDPVHYPRCGHEVIFANPIW
jgi:hypothetical protein